MDHGCHYFYQGQLTSKARPGFQKNLKSKTYQVWCKAIVISEAHSVKVEWLESLGYTCKYYLFLKTILI